MNIYDIAKRSGVSIATVSRVLNNSDKVSAGTREKVLAVIAEESYTPNAFARGLGLNTMKMVGILCTDVSDIFFAKAVSLVENSLREKGLDALLCCTGNSLENKKKSLELLLQKRVDAVVLIGSVFKEEVDNSHLEMAARQVPVLLINALIELPGVTCVVSNEQEIMTKVVDLLCSGGSQKIFYLYDALTFSGQQKILGFQAGCRHHGLEKFDERIVQVPKTIDGAREAIEKLLAQNVAIDAVIASEDQIAVGAQKAFMARGMQIPVIGYNNSILAQCASPTLTSIDNMLDTLCPTSIQLLVDILAGKSVPAKMVVASQFVERESCQLSKFAHGLK